MKNNIRAYRQNTGLTQKDLARRLNVSLRSVSRWESGKHDPRASDLHTMAGLFCCGVDDLICADEARVPPGTETRKHTSVAIMRCEGGSGTF